MQTHTHLYTYTPTQNELIERVNVPVAGNREPASVNTYVEGEKRGREGRGGE